MTKDGRLLADLQREGILFDQTLEIARQVASTLAAASVT
jgi:hypothetical protein